MLTAREAARRVAFAPAAPAMVVPTAVVILAAAVILALLATSARAQVVVPGYAWAQGRGVDVCYPAAAPCAGNAPEGGIHGAPWQCVELAQRFYTHMGWYGGLFVGVTDADQIFGWAAGGGMIAHRNGSGYVPVPGDMIVSAGDRAVPAGHVAIVDSVDLIRGIVHAVEQNANPSGRSTYRLVGPWLTRPGPYGAIIGVVHSPADGLRTTWDGRFHAGAIYRSRPGGPAYLIAGGARFALAGPRELGAFGYLPGRIITVPARALARVPTAPRAGSLLRARGDAHVYLIAGGARLWIHSVQDIALLHRRLGEIQLTPAGGLARLPQIPRDGTLLRAVGDPQTWVITGGHRAPAPAAASAAPIVVPPSTLAAVPTA